MRGENGFPFCLSDHLPGTSPRARGKHTGANNTSAEYRNIPACAGKTSCRWCVAMRCGEHPRVRGENGVARSRSSSLMGTSPRARGKLHGQVRSQVPNRNIPACAGKTRYGHSGESHRAEHPRVRGENRIRRRSRFRSHGTSPRARGKLLLTCGSSFLRVILHSVLFFCTVGVPWNPPAAPSFLSVLVPESSFTASSGPACFRLTAALFGGTVDDF